MSGRSSVHRSHLSVDDVVVFIAMPAAWTRWDERGRRNLALMN
jgi:hypothetical protein